MCRICAFLAPSGTPPLYTGERLATVAEWTEVDHFTQLVEQTDALDNLCDSAGPLVAGNGNLLHRIRVDSFLLVIELIAIMMIRLIQGRRVLGG